MYRIVLKNVGKDMVNKDRIVAVFDINSATVLAYDMVKSVLEYGKSFHFSVVGDDILVIVDDITVGSLTMTKLH